MSKVVFVTVGTTQFDSLIKTVTQQEIYKEMLFAHVQHYRMSLSPAVLQCLGKFSVKKHHQNKILKSKGYDKLLLQIGQCEFEPSIDTTPGFDMEFYRYKPSLDEDMCHASLVISHAGAGSCLEALGANKPLLVVINDALMDNHQLELANQLKKDQHIEYCTCSTFAKTLKDSDFSKLKPFPPGEPQKFASFLDSVMGYS